MADTARFLRPRHWLLMALRILALGLVVAAFMQPIWYAAAAPDMQAGEHVVIVVDRTASMQRTVGGTTLFDEARRQAIAALDELAPSRDLASVVMLDRHCRSLLPEPSANFSALRAALLEQQPTWEDGQLTDALAQARTLHQIIGRDGDGRRPLRVHVFSDAQRTQHAGGSELPGGVRMHQVGAFAANAAVSDPAMMPSHPIANQPVTISCEVANFSEETARLPVMLRLDGKEQTQTITVPPFGRSTASFRTTFAQPGLQVVELTLDDARGALQADDRTGRVASVRAARQVTLITTADPNDPTTAAYFLTRALTPPAAGVAMQVRSPDAVTLQSPAEGPAVWVIVEAGALPPALLVDMRGHLDAGGGVLWLVDSPDAAASLARLSDVTGVAPPIMPAAGQAWDAVAWRELAVGRFDDQVLEVFQGPARSALMSSRFGATLRGAAGPEAVPLLTYEDGRPALALRWLGSGRFAVWGASLRPADSDLVKGPLLVPLVHQLVRHLAPGPPVEPNVQPGQPLGLSLPTGATVTAPGGDVLQAVGEADAPGPYIVRTDEDIVDARWVELHAAESDLRTVEHPSNGEVNDSPAAAATAAPALLREQGFALWPWLMLAALLLLATESACLMKMSGWRRGGDADV